MSLTVSNSEIEQFRQDGFIGLRQVCSHEEILEIRRVLEDLYSRNVGVKEGAQFDVLKPYQTEAVTLGQLTNPSNFAPALKKTALFQRAHDIANQLLGPKAFCSADFVLMKPAFQGAATPWHQDQAYGKLDYDFEQFTLWLPLQDVDESSGCLQFVPGTHMGPIMPHQSANNDSRAHSLETLSAPSPETIVSVPLKMGDCSLHNGRVLHGSPANRSPVARYAYILVFRNPTVPSAEAAPFPWVKQRKDVIAERRNAWFRHGGFLVLLWRKFREGTFSDAARLRITLREAFVRLQKR